MPNGYKAVSIKYGEFEVERQKWADQHGVILTMPQFLLFLLDSYKKKAKL